MISYRTKNGQHGPKGVHPSTLAPLTRSVLVSDYRKMSLFFLFKFGVPHNCFERHRITGLCFFLGGIISLNINLFTYLVIGRTTPVRIFGSRGSGDL